VRREDVSWWAGSFLAAGAAAAGATARQEPRGDTSSGLRGYS
jgi:hypothetical protein